MILLFNWGIFKVPAMRWGKHHFDSQACNAWQRERSWEPRYNIEKDIAAFIKKEFDKTLGKSNLAQMRKLSDGSGQSMR